METIVGQKIFENCRAIASKDRKNGPTGLTFPRPVVAGALFRF